MIRCDQPRCCDCAMPLPEATPVTGSLWHGIRCVSCGAALQIRRDVPDGYQVRNAEHPAGHAVTRRLPAVATPAERAGFLAACGRVARLLQPCEGVEPGFAAYGRVGEPAEVVNG